MYNFNNAVEQESKSFVGTGIHDFKVDKIVFQKEGASTHGETDKNGPKNFGWDQIRVFLTCIKTHAGDNSTGGKVVIDITDPARDSTKLQAKLNRILHIFSSMSSKDTKENAKKYIQGLNVASFEELGAKLAKFNGKTVRLKFITNDKNYPTFPGFNSGIAECADVPFEQSLLKYNPATEGTVKLDKSNTEDASTSNDYFGTTNTPADTNDDDLPF